MYSFDVYGLLDIVKAFLPFQMSVDSYGKANLKYSFNCSVLVLISQEKPCVGSALGKGFHPLLTTSLQKNQNTSTDSLW